MMRGGETPPLSTVQKPLESFDRKEDGSVELDSDATAIMLRRLPAKFTAESLSEVLDEFLPGQYNFVYVPHDKRKLRNLALAFLNFTDPQSARTAYAFLRVKHSTLGPTIRVYQADIQGLGSNLAYFVARFGFQEMNNPHAPLVFENGIRQTNMLEAVKRHVTLELLLQAHHRMEMQASKLAPHSAVQQSPCCRDITYDKLARSQTEQNDDLNLGYVSPQLEIPTPCFFKAHQGTPAIQECSYTDAPLGSRYPLVFQDLRGRLIYDL